jgi:hypothetical protein
MKEAGPTGFVTSWASRAGYAFVAESLAGVANEQGSRLAGKVAGANRLDEQRVRVFPGPIFLYSERRIAVSTNKC